jgi:segregation and condensation protein B
MHLQQSQIKAIAEAALLAAAQPLSVAQLLQLFDERDGVSQSALGAALTELADDCGERGVELREVASGFRLQIKAEWAPRVSRLWTERQSRYSRALLETLALIAYRQPITRGEIEAVRGVAVATSIIKTLEEREWIRVLGHRDLPGRPALFGTTRAFLDYFNLKSLDELPTLAEIRDLENLEPELAFPSDELPTTPAPIAASDAVEQQPATPAVP